jgi:hypothetical protein
MANGEWRIRISALFHYSLLAIRYSPLSQELDSTTMDGEDEW